MTIERRFPEQSGHADSHSSQLELASYGARRSFQAGALLAYLPVFLRLGGGDRRCGCSGCRWSSTGVCGAGRKQQQRTFEVAPRRGVLYDRNLRELAMTVQVDSIYAVPQ